MWAISNEGAVRTLRIDRVDAMNSLSIEIIQQLIQELNNAATDDSVKVLILTGTGKIFSSGMDVNIFVNADDEKNNQGLREFVPLMFDTFIDFPKPLVIAVNGMGVGFGATVCGLADVLIMAESARLKSPFASLGLVPEGCSTVSFPRLMGHQQAYWMLMADEWYDAETCKSIGLANAVVPDDQLMDEAMSRAQRLAKMPMISLVETKRMMVEPYREAMRRANRDELTKINEQLHFGAACKEGLTAFMEKRAPDYSQL